MNQDASKQTPEVRVVLRQLRDAGLERAAQVVLAVTSSARYQRASAALAKPGFIMSAVAREKADQAMRRVLSVVNMPSRSDVLQLSTRLTHIEMTLDDLAANVDAVVRASSTSSSTRPATAPESPVTAPVASPAAKARRAPRRAARTAEAE